jgi:anti-sigma factor RsiW
MKCRNIQKRLPVYQDGELSSVEQDRIKAHLTDCPECSKRYKELQRVWDLLSDLPDIQPMPGFHLQLRKKISGLGEHQFIPRLRQVFQLLPAQLAMVTLLLVGLLTGIYLGNVIFEESLTPFKSRQPGSAQEHVSLASIRTFDAVPPGSLAHGYLRMASHSLEAHR